MARIVLESFLLKLQSRLSYCPVSPVRASPQWWQTWPHRPSMVSTWCVNRRCCWHWEHVPVYGSLRRTTLVVRRWSPVVGVPPRLFDGSLLFCGELLHHYENPPWGDRYGTTQEYLDVARCSGITKSFMICDNKDYGYPLLARKIKRVPPTSY